MATIDSRLTKLENGAKPPDTVECWIGTAETLTGPGGVRLSREEFERTHPKVIRVVLRPHERRC
jgi:hypothetical protein